MKPSALGDVIQTLPLVGALRHRFPQAHLAWVVNRSYAELLEDHPDLDEVIGFDRSGRGVAFWRGVHRLVQRLRAGQFDLVCDLQGLLRSGLMAAVSGASRRVGLSTAREGAAWFYTDTVQVPTLEMSAVDRYWLLAEALGAGEAPKRFTIALSAEPRTWAQGELASLPRPRLAVHPGARWITKRWPLEQFTAVAQRAQEQFEASIVVVGGPEESENGRRMAAALPGPAVSLAGRTGLKQLAAVLAEVDLVLTGDSGPMHLAAALGTPVVGIFTCTNPLRAGPYGPGHTVVATHVDCAASYLKTCPRLDCMHELSVARVWPAVAAQLVKHQAATCASPVRSSA